jgi:hypothetical protein
MKHVRQPFDQFAFTKSEISAFRELSKRSLSISELAVTLGKSQASASFSTSSLLCLSEF